MNNRKKQELLARKISLEHEIEYQLEIECEETAKLLNRDLENVNAALALEVIKGAF